MQIKMSVQTYGMQFFNQINYLNLSQYSRNKLSKLFLPKKIIHFTTRKNIDIFWDFLNSDILAGIIILPYIS